MILAFQCIVFKVNLKPFPGKPSLEIATVGSFSSVVPQGKYQPGQKVVFLPAGLQISKNFLKQLKAHNLLSPNYNRLQIRQAYLYGVKSEGLIYPAQPEWKIGQVVNQELGYDLARQNMFIKKPLISQSHSRLHKIFNPQLDFSKTPTRQLKAWHRSFYGQRVDEDMTGEEIIAQRKREEAIKAELQTREHIPNKNQSKLIRKMSKQAGKKLTLQEAQQLDKKTK